MNFDNENYWSRSTTKSFDFDDDTNTLDTLTDCTEIESVFNDISLTDEFFANNTATPISSAAGNLCKISIKSLISDDTLKAILDEQSLVDSLLPKGLTAEEELKSLRRQIHNIAYVPSPKITLTKLLLGKAPSLEVYKSLHDKQQLLDTVLQNGCPGDAVLYVLLFLERTLLPQEFHAILKTRPQALQHYINYIQQKPSQEDMQKTLTALEKHNINALVQYKNAYDETDLNQVKQKIGKCLEMYSGSDAIVPIYYQMMNKSLKLFETLESLNAKADSNLNAKSSAVEVLYECCKNINWKDKNVNDLPPTAATSTASATSATPQTYPICPFQLCEQQEISQIQFEWTTLNACCEAQAYADLEHIFAATPNWLPIKQKQFQIHFPIELAITRVYKLNAPTSVIYYFLCQMANTVEKLGLAEKVKCTKAVIDALVAMKDLNRLCELRDSLPERSEEQFYCEKGIKSVQGKRWSTDNIKLKF